MKKIKFITIIAGALLTGSMLLSCEDYLDKAPESEISDSDVYSKFNTFQGFIEDIYQCVVDVANRDIHGMGNWNWGDDVVGAQGKRMGDFAINGDYMTWRDTDVSPFFAGSKQTGNGESGNGRSKRGYWDHGWLGIRKANMALANLDQLVEPYGSASLEEQKNLIAGQAYFFRGYFHFEIMRAWGGIPYIDQMLMPDMEMTFPRLSYAETAEKAALDFEMAANLLPEDWDDIATGQITAGKNEGRLTKGAAYGYLGKNWLYAASPLMNGVSTGNYEYNIEYCKRAAQAFMEVIKLADKGVYGLVPFSEYSNNFYKNDNTAPWTVETIFKNPVYGHSQWNHGSEILVYCGGWSNYASPTENYVENFGMANGLPISVKGYGDVADSGYDPSDPWTGRDPRFYYNILIDGDQIVESDAAPRKTAQLYVGGEDRSAGNSVTGYGYRKFHHLRRNNKDDGMKNSFYMQCPQMRLADVYLMYAEAVNEAYGPNVAPVDIPDGLTAAEAVNRVRARAGVPDVDSRFLTDKTLFREIIRQERAVELAFEGHRWYDLRRWYIAHEKEYKELYALEFDAGHTYFKKVLYQTKTFEMKHYWLPFESSQVSIYPGFYQNPGW